jgi:hypothetical protein
MRKAASGRPFLKENRSSGYAATMSTLVGTGGASVTVSGMLADKVAPL